MGAITVRWSWWWGEGWIFMGITPEKIKALLEDELSTLKDPRVLSHIRSLLVEPVVSSREWDYGESEQSFPCWLVLAHPSSNTGIAYCEFGFGPRTPWGLVFLSDRSMGMDCGWFAFFLASYFESQAAADLAIWRVFKRTNALESGLAVTEESDWDSTWKEVERLRSAEPNLHYDCWHDIQCGQPSS